MCPPTHRGKASKNATFESVTGMLLDSLGIFFSSDVTKDISENKIAKNITGTISPNFMMGCMGRFCLCLKSLFNFNSKVATQTTSPASAKRKDWLRMQMFPKDSQFRNMKTLGWVIMVEKENI